MAISKAKTNADILATDPDADRVGVELEIKWKIYFAKWQSNSFILLRVIKLKETNKLPQTHDG